METLRFIYELGVGETGYTVPWAYDPKGWTWLPFHLGGLNLLYHVHEDRGGSVTLPITRVDEGWIVGTWAAGTKRLCYPVVRLPDHVDIERDVVPIGEEVRRRRKEWMERRAKRLARRRLRRRDPRSNAPPEERVRSAASVLAGISEHGWRIILRAEIKIAERMREMAEEV